MVGVGGPVQARLHKVVDNFMHVYCIEVEGPLSDSDLCGGKDCTRMVVQ